MWGRIPAVAVLALVALPVGGASAAPVTVGSPLTAAFGQQSVDGPATLLNSVLPGATLAAPFAGKVVRWRVAGSGRFALQVLRPAEDGSYARVKTSAVMAVTGGEPRTFATSLPVEAGQVVGLLVAEAPATIGTVTTPGAAVSSWSPSLALGRAPDARAEDTEVAFSADVLRPPTVTGLSPDRGPVAGGTTVVITGTDLGEATQVRFGFTPARSFRVDSDTQITAVTPALSSARTQHVEVTTPAGRSDRAATPAFGFGLRTPGSQTVPPAKLKLTFTPWLTRTALHLPVVCRSLALERCALRVRMTSLHGRPVSYGTRRLTLEPRVPATVLVPLNRTARRRLARARRLPVRVTATWSNDAGVPTKLTTRTIVARLPR